MRCKLVSVRVLLCEKGTRDITFAMKKCCSALWYEQGFSLRACEIARFKAKLSALPGALLSEKPLYLRPLAGHMLWLCRIHSDQHDAQ